MFVGATKYLMKNCCFISSVYISSFGTSSSNINVILCDFLLFEASHVYINTFLNENDWF